MLDGPLDPFFSNCKVLLNASRNRLKAIGKSAETKQKILQVYLSQLLSNKLDISAYIRTEEYISGEDILICYRCIDQSCEKIANGLSKMQQQRDCPVDCREAVATLIFAASRFSELPELQKLKNAFQHRYEGSVDAFVTQHFVERLSSTTAIVESLKRIKVLQDIASKYGIQWDYKGFEERIDTPTVKEAMQLPDPAPSNGVEFPQSFPNEVMQLQFGSVLPRAQMPFHSKVTQGMQLEFGFCGPVARVQAPSFTDKASPSSFTSLSSLKEVTHIPYPRISEGEFENLFKWNNTHFNFLSIRGVHDSATTGYSLSCEPVYNIRDWAHHKLSQIQISDDEPAVTLNLWILHYKHTIRRIFRDVIQGLIQYYLKHENACGNVANIYITPRGAEVRLLPISDSRKNRHDDLEALSLVVKRIILFPLLQSPDIELDQWLNHVPEKLRQALRIFDRQRTTFENFASVPVWMIVDQPVFWTVLEQKRYVAVLKTAILKYSETFGAKFRFVGYRNGVLVDWQSRVQDKSLRRVLSKGKAGLYEQDEMVGQNWVAVKAYDDIEDLPRFFHAVFSHINPAPVDFSVKYIVDLIEKDFPGIWFDIYHTALQALDAVRPDHPVAFQAIVNLLKEFRIPSDEDNVFADFGI